MRMATPRPAAKRIQTARAAAAGESRHGFGAGIGRAWRGAELYTLRLVQPNAMEAPQRARWRRVLPWTAAAGLYAALTLVYFWPLPRLWRDHPGPDLGDPLFNL